MLHMKKINVPTLIKSKKSLKIKNHSFRTSMIAVQHNNLVQAKYSMTLQQKRIIMWLSSQITSQDEDFKEHVLSVKELIDVCELSGESAYREIRNITFSLIEKGIRIIDITDPSRGKEVQVPWLLAAKYDKGEVRLKFSPDLKPYLLQLKSQFTKIDITDLMQFKSVHAIRVYELLKQYKEIGERTMKIDEIKEYCGVEGRLKTYPNFKNKLLLIAQREINAKSDIYFDFMPVKHGRKFVAIKFNISKNMDYEVRKASDRVNVEYKAPERRPPVFDTLREFGFSIATVNKLIKENTEEVIKNAIDAVDLQIAKGNVRNTKAMIRTAIKEKWSPDKHIIR